MKILFKQVTILDIASSYHLQTVDVLVENGVIANIENTLNELADTTIIENGLYLSTGFLDVFAHFNDPGYEQKETLITGAKAAQKGGYTSVMIVPNTNPVIDSKTSIEYVLQQSKNLPINILPIGSITTNNDGATLAQMIEMNTAGAVAYSDGLQPIKENSLLLKALQYVKIFDGTLIQMPTDATTPYQAQVNESITATQLGLQGMPSVLEHIMVATNVELCAYTNSKLHITGVSTAKSMAIITAAKQQNVGVTCSVSPYHLLLHDAEINTYNTNAKVNPPLRSKADVMALQNALLQGDIDCIASHHIPQEQDAKQCEFAAAQFGMSTIEHTFNAIATVPNISPVRVYEVLSYMPHLLFNQPTTTIAVGNACVVTAFTLNNSTAIKAHEFVSKSNNSAFVGKVLKGKIVATINGNHNYINK